MLYFPCKVFIWEMCEVLSNDFVDCVFDSFALSDEIGSAARAIIHLHSFILLKLQRLNLNARESEV